MQVMRTIIAALLAACMAIFPIAMPQASALAGHSHTSAATADARTADVIDAAGHAHLCDEASDAAHHEHASHNGNPDNGQTCCGSMTCHAFQVSAAPSLVTRLRLSGVVHISRDQQVALTFSGRLDRPPRTA